MRKLLIVASILIASSAWAGGSKKSNPSSVQAWLANQRKAAIEDMAPKIGLDPAPILKVGANFKACEHDGLSKDFGPWVDGAINECAEVDDKVHAWCMPSKRITRYMFATVGSSKASSKEIVVACVRHEVMHELLNWYGIGGHPLKVSIKRQDNGKSQTFKPAEIIGGRWPSMVNVFVPESMESQTDWLEFPCGSEEIMRGDGEGI